MLEIILLRFYLVTFSLLLLLGCSRENFPQNNWQTIKGRNESKAPIYRVNVPIGWTRRSPLPEESLTDTTKPLCEFYIHDKNEVIKITIHNFPSDQLAERIPPSVQIARWQKQFQKIEPEQISIIPQAFSGFSGLLFQGTGIMHNALTTVLGWSMQIAPEHYQALYYPETSEERLLFPQMRADFTIKVVGPKEAVQRHMRALMAFARSFELVEDIPPQ